MPAWFPWWGSHFLFPPAMDQVSNYFPYFQNVYSNTLCVCVCSFDCGLSGISFWFWCTSFWWLETGGIFFPKSFWPLELTYWGNASSNLISAFKLSCWTLGCWITLLKENEPKRLSSVVLLLLLLSCRCQGKDKFIMWYLYPYVYFWMYSLPGVNCIKSPKPQWLKKRNLFCHYAENQNPKSSCGKSWLVWKL